MRVWFSGPRLFRGFVRPGISLGKEDLRAIRKAPAMAVTAGMVLFRRKDGAILMAIGDKNGPVESGYPDIPMTDMPPVVAFSFPSTLAAVDAKEGAKVRLAKHIGQEGLVVGLSVGQVVAAIKAEMAALDIEGKFTRIKIEAAPEAGTKPPLSNSTGVGYAGLPQHQPEHDWGTVLVCVAVWGVLGIPLWILVAHWLGFVS